MNVQCTHRTHSVYTHTYSTLSPYHHHIAAQWCSLVKTRTVHRIVFPPSLGVMYKGVRGGGYHRFVLAMYLDNISFDSKVLRILYHIRIT